MYFYVYLMYKFRKFNMDRKDYNAILIPVAEFFRLRELLRPPMPGLASPWCRCPPTERTL
jgi:hypothetical protein